MALTRDALLENAKERLGKVENIGPVPGLGDEDAYIRHLTVRERNEWAALRLRALEVGDAGGAFGPYLESRVLLVALALCDESGDRLFEDADEVAGLHPDPVDYIADQAERVNGLSVEAAEDIKGN